MTRMNLFKTNRKEKGNLQIEIRSGAPIPIENEFTY